MVNDIVKSLQGDIEKAIEAFRRELGKVRTGRANLSILDATRQLGRRCGLRRGGRESGRSSYRFP